MRKENLKVGVIAGAAWFSLMPAVHAAVISGGTALYADSFNRTASTLNGSTPDVTNNGYAWVSAAATAGTGAPDAIFTLSDGATTSVTSPTNPTTAEDTSNITDAFLRFTPVAGYIYDFSVSADILTSATGGHWAAIGLLDNTDPHEGPTVGGIQYPDTGDGNAAMTNLAPEGLIIPKDTGVAQFFSGSGTNSPTVSPAILSGFNTYDIVLDTTSSNWVIKQYLNSTLEQSYTYATDPNIGFIGIGVNRVSASFDNLSLSATYVPEPASLAVLGLGGILLAQRRRSSAAR
jgi:hypothetical protein